MEPSFDSLKVRLDPLQAYSKPNNAAKTLIHASSMRQTNEHQTALRLVRIGSCLQFMAMDLCAGYAAFQTRKQCFENLGWRIMDRTWLHAAMVGMSASMWDEGNQPAAETQLTTFQGVKPKLMDARLLPAFMQCYGPTCSMFFY
jgi:hypothetical protein